MVMGWTGRGKPSHQLSGSRDFLLKVDTHAEENILVIGGNELFLVFASKYKNY
jgi:hypothetical protein